MFTIVVAGMLLIVGAFVAFWVLRPESRAWIESPKYEMLSQRQGSDDTRV